MTDPLTAAIHTFEHAFLGRVANASAKLSRHPGRKECGLLSPPVRARQPRTHAI